MLMFVLVQRFRYWGCCLNCVSVERVPILAGCFCCSGCCVAALSLVAPFAREVAFFFLVCCLVSIMGPIGFWGWVFLVFSVWLLLLSKSMVCLWVVTCSGCICVCGYVSSRFCGFFLISLLCFFCFGEKHSAVPVRWLLFSVILVSVVWLVPLSWLVVVFKKKNDWFWVCECLVNTNATYQMGLVVWTFHT